MYRKTRSGGEECGLELNTLVWYLIPNVTYKDGVEFYRGAGVVFPDTARGIKVKLKEERLLFPGSGRAFDYQISPSLPRVLRIAKPFDVDVSVC